MSSVKSERGVFVGKRDICELTGLSGPTLKKYRSTGIWIEGIHWIRLSGRMVLYNRPMIKDWIENRHDPEAHQRVIEAYQANRLSQQLKSEESG